MSRYTVELILRGTSQGIDGAIGGAVKGLQGLGDAAMHALGTLGGNLMTAAIQGVADLGREIADSLVNEAPALEGVRRSFENLAASAGMSADEVLASMREASSGMITDADLMTSYNQALLLVGENMAGEFPALLEIAQASAAATGEDVGFMLDSLVRGIGRASPMILDNLGLTINLSEVMEGYAATVGKSADELTKAEQQQALLNAVVAQGGEFVARLGDNTGGAASSVGSFQTTLENLKNNIAVGLLPALVALLEPLAGLVEQYGPQVVAWAVEAGTWLGTNIPVAVARMREIWNEVMPHIERLLQGFQAVANEVWPFVLGLIERVVGWVQENLPLITAEGQSIADFWTNTLQPITAQVWELLQAIIRGALDVILGVVQVFLGVVHGDWDAVWSGIQSIVEGVWAAIHGIIETVLEIIARLMGSSLDEIRATWAGNFEMLWEIVSTIFDWIVAYIGGIDLAQMGRDLIQGLINGISGMVGNVTGAISGVIDAGINAAKGLLGIQSPSTVFAGMGEQLSAGLALGVTRGTRLAESAVEGLVEGAVQASVDKRSSMTVYGGVQMYGVQDAPGLLGQLQGMAVG